MDIDFERSCQERKFNPSKLSLNQVYQMIKEEAAGAKVTLDEVKALLQFVREKSGDAALSDDIDINDIINAVMDVSLENTGAKPLNETGPSNRYSTDNSKPERKEEYLAMQQLALSNAEKAESLQRVVFSLQAEKRELSDRIEKLEQGKLRMEKILKQSLKSTTQANPNGELLEEIAMITKRIEFMEHQSDERYKSQYLDHNHCQRQLQHLQQELDGERAERVKLLQKKNAEVAYFKAELDALLGEIAAQQKRK